MRPIIRLLSYTFTVYGLLLPFDTEEWKRIYDRLKRQWYLRRTRPIKYLVKQVRPSLQGDGTLYVRYLIKRT